MLLHWLPCCHQDSTFKRFRTPEFTTSKPAGKSCTIRHRLGCSAFAPFDQNGVAKDNLSLEEQLMKCFSTAPRKAPLESIADYCRSLVVCFITIARRHSSNKILGEPFQNSSQEDEAQLGMRTSKIRKLIQKLTRLSVKELYPKSKVLWEIASNLIGIRHWELRNDRVGLGREIPGAWMRWF